MSLPPVIVNFLFESGLGLENPGALWIGLVWRQAEWLRVVWEAYHPSLHVGSGPLSAAPTIDQARASLAQTVLPALAGQTLEPLLATAARLDSLYETVQVVEPAPVKADGRQDVVSRRDILRGDWKTKPVPMDDAPRQRSVTRQLHPALRYVISTLLLQAAAKSCQMTVAEWMLSRFGLGTMLIMPAMQVDVVAARRVLGHQAVQQAVANLVYQTGQVDAERQLGANAELLQRYVRDLAAWLDGAERGASPIGLHIALSGALGRLYAGNRGRLFGAIAGLRSATAGRALTLEDPVAGATLPEQITLFKAIREFLRFHHLEVQLATSMFVNDAPDIHTLAQSEVVDRVILDPVVAGGWHRLILAVEACRAAGIRFVIRFGPGVPTGIAAEAGLVLQPDVLQPPPDGHDAGIIAMRDALSTTHAWLAHSQAQKPHPKPEEREQSCNDAN